MTQPRWSSLSRPRPSRDSSSPTGPRSPAGSSGPAADSGSRLLLSTPTPMLHCPTSGRPYTAVPLPGLSPAGDLPAHRPRHRRRVARSGADAILPGYGFLRPSTLEFARAVVDAGLGVGRPDFRLDRSDGIEGRGQEADLAVCGGGPALRSLAVETASEADLSSHREGLCLVVAACAGRGSSAGSIEFPDQVAAASAEGGKAFGDPTVFVERYVEHVRHVEVQVVGHSGGVLVLGDRVCSPQASSPEGGRGGAAGGPGR